MGEHSAGGLGRAMHGLPPELAVTIPRPLGGRTTLSAGGTMAASFMKRTMAYLGLVDDEYDDYDDYDARGPGAVSRVSQRVVTTEEPDNLAPPGPPSRIRTLNRDENPQSSSSGPGPVPVAQSVSPRPSSVRPLAPEPSSARVHIVARFDSATPRRSPTG